MNKLEITDVMICEWDAVTKCMIVSPADGWKVKVASGKEQETIVCPKGTMSNFYARKSDGADIQISEAHASMVTMEKMGPDYSHLIGKWVKAIGADIHCVRTGKWYQALREIDGGLVVSDENGDNDYVWTNPQNAYDLTDARDYNPDERKPHQLKEYDAVECTPEERAEIIMIADECGVRVFAPTEPLEGQTSLLFFRGVISGTSIRSICDDAGIKRDWHTVPDFISKIRGEYTAVNVTEHKHESV